MCIHIIEEKVVVDRAELWATARGKAQVVPELRSFAIPDRGLFMFPSRYGTSLVRRCGYFP